MQCRLLEEAVALLSLVSAWRTFSIKKCVHHEGYMLRALYYHRVRQDLTNYSHRQSESRLNGGQLAATFIRVRHTAADQATTKASKSSRTHHEHHKHHQSRGVARQIPTLRSCRTPRMVLVILRVVCGNHLAMSSSALVQMRG